MIILIHHLRADECTSLHTMVEYLEYIVKLTLVEYKWVFCWKKYVCY